MKIDTDAIKNDVKKLSMYVTAVKSEKNKLISLISDIEDAWKGKKATEFATNLYEIYIKELNDLEAILENYSDFLSKIPRAYEMLDEEYSSKKINV